MRRMYGHRDARAMYASVSRGGVNVCGSTHAPAVLWFVERYRRALKERRADESAPPTQKEITMKKLLAIKGRRSDGENDAHEKGDSRKKHCLFAILHIP